MMLEREIQLAQTRGETLLDGRHWADVTRHTTDMLEVAGTLHRALHEVFRLPREVCPACGAESEDDAWDVVDVEALDELAELASGDD